MLLQQSPVLHWAPAASWHVLALQHGSLHSCVGGGEKYKYNRNKEREIVYVLVSGSKARWNDVKGKDHVHGSKVIKMG